MGVLHVTRVRLAVSVALLSIGALAVLTGVYLLVGLAATLILAGLACFATEWLVP
jgi:hypothetical protein